MCGNFCLLLPTQVAKVIDGGGDHLLQAWMDSSPGSCYVVRRDTVEAPGVKLQQWRILPRGVKITQEEG